MQNQFTTLPAGRLRNAGASGVDELRARAGGNRRIARVDRGLRMRGARGTVEGDQELAATGDAMVTTPAGTTTSVPPVASGTVTSRLNGKLALATDSARVVVPLVVDSVPAFSTELAPGAKGNPARSMLVAGANPKIGFAGTGTESSRSTPAPVKTSDRFPPSLP